MFTSSGTGTSDTKITATFKDSDATIVASGETVELFLTGIKNPASTKAQLNFKVTVGAVDLDGIFTESNTYVPPSVGL